MYAAAVALTAGFAGLAYKAWTVQVRDGERMRALGRAQYLRELTIPAPRGSIRDTNGVELAVSVGVDSVFASPRDVVDVAATAGKVADVLGLDVRDVEAKLGSARHFEWLKRRVSPSEARRIKALAAPGIGLISEPRRFYPARDLAGPVLGFAGLDGVGLEGVELSLDSELRGEQATMPALRDGRGDFLLAMDGEPEDRGAVAGATVTLTIDRFIQFSAERALADTVRENKAKDGIIVVMDPKTGEILALANWPTFDPNDASRRADARDRAVTDAFEPGSVMKVFSVSAALEAGVVSEKDNIDTEGGKLVVGRHAITDTHAHGVISVAEVIKFSSNVGAAKIARKLGSERLATALRGFGFGSRTGVELPGERSGSVRDPRRWGEIGLATASFGYGLTVTPLQLAVALSAVANDGMAAQPAIVKRVVAADGRLLHEHMPNLKRAISIETAEKMREMLKLVVQKGGTADNVKVPGFVVAGKTGTAMKPDPVTKRYGSVYLSSFIGFAPADDPRLLIVVMIDEPRGEKHFGGQVAAPAFARIAEECLKYLGVAGHPDLVTPGAGAAPEPEPEPEPVLPADFTSEPDVAPAGPGEDIVLIPDFAGMSVGQALAAARAAGVKVEVDGSGKAVSQFPPAGRALKSITCHVTFDPG